MKHSMFVGLDVHQKSTSVAFAEAGRGGEVRFHGEIWNTADAMRRLNEKLERHGRQLHPCHEAGSIGYRVHPDMACIDRCGHWTRMTSRSPRR